MDGINDMESHKMTDSKTLAFAINKSASPTPTEERVALLEDHGFGNLFTDHMAMIRWSEDRGCYDAQIQSREPNPMDPASSVLQYAQDVVVDMKAYTLTDAGTGV